MGKVVLWNRNRSVSHRFVAAAALLSLAIGLLWSTQAVTEVFAYDEVTSIDPWGERGAFTYEPIVTDGGGSLPMGEPGYFTTQAPRVVIHFTWTLDDTRSERVTAIGDLSLRVHQPASPGRAAWTYDEPLAQAPLEGAADGTLALDATIDLPATQERIEATPGRDAENAEWRVRAIVRFATSPIATHRADASEFVLPIDYTPPLYTLPSEQEATISKDHGQSQTTRHEETGGASALVAKPVGPMLLLAGIIGILVTLPGLAREWEETA